MWDMPIAKGDIEQTNKQTDDPNNRNTEQTNQNDFCLNAPLVSPLNFPFSFV